MSESLVGNFSKAIVVVLITVGARETLNTTINSIMFKVLLIAVIMALRFATFNMHGWANGSHMVDSLCNNTDVIFLQEHWLLPNNLQTIVDFKSDTFSCYAISGVLDMVQYSQNGGGPYGGVFVL